MVVKATLLIFPHARHSVFTCTGRLSSTQLPLTSTTDMIISGMKKLRQEQLEDSVKLRQSKRRSLGTHPGSLGSELEISTTPYTEIN